jgi:uncharacterized membrane protein
MTKLLVIIFFLIAFFLTQTKIVFAEPPDELNPNEAYVRGVVIEAKQGDFQVYGKSKTYSENLKVKLQDGKEIGKIVNIIYSTDATYGNQVHLVKGEEVIVDAKVNPDGTSLYIIRDPYRLNKLIPIVILFIVLLIIFGGTKGIGALVGLSINLLTLIGYIIPQILNGKDPLTTCLIGSFFILLVSTYIAHGISMKTTVALVGTATALVIGVIISIFSVRALHLLGYGNETIQILQTMTPNGVNPQGVLLGGIIIGTLGALNDLTTTQSITIFTMAGENPKQKVSRLFHKGIAIGREHIASLINTLVLAYAGSSFVVFLFFISNPIHLPWWMLLNDQTAIEEIVRMLTGSMALILAVPITTFIASYVALHKNLSNQKP